MQAILLVTVFSCLLGTASAAAADGAVGGACLPDSKCTDSTSVCESNICKIKAEAACPAASTDCVSHSTCPASGSSLTCTCDTGYTAQTGQCKIKAGQTCTSGSTDCVSHSTCPASGKCTCDGSYTETSTGLCNGVVPQSVSSWLLTGSIITLLVTLSLP